MYIKYVSNAASTAAQVVADLALLASGGAIAGCSASCDKVSSTVLANTLAAGWTLVDSAAPLSGAVISAPDADARTTKYARIFASTATTIGIDGYETWNTGTHAGTNQTFTSSTTVHLTYSTAAINTYYLMVEPRFVLIGNPAGTLLTGLVEYARDSAFLVGTSYPVVGMINSTIGMNSTLAVVLVSRMKNLIAAGDLTGSGASLVLNTAAISGLQTTAILDQNEVSYHPIYPLWVSKAGTDTAIVVGKVQNLYLTTKTFGAAFDEVSDGVDTYIVIGNGGHAAVKKA